MCVPLLPYRKRHSWRCDGRRGCKEYSWFQNSIRGIFLSDCQGGSVAVPERLREFVTNFLSPEADVLEQVVVEFAQFLQRTGAPSPQLAGGDDPPDYRQRRDLPRLGAPGH